MNKSILVVNEPDTCRNCILWQRDYYKPYESEDNKPIHFVDICHGKPMTQIYDIDVYTEKPDWCPLIPEPERQCREDGRYDCYADGYLAGTIDGWNDCLDALDGKERWK